MKVVIFCGGLGVRMGEATQHIPKPLVSVGGQPILWHIMKYYASHGHDDFVLCLGNKGHAIKEFFLQYRETLANDFVLGLGGRSIRLLNREPADWRIAFVDTGSQSAIGERLRRVREHLAGEEMFMATYGDGLTDAPVNDLAARLARSGKTGIFLSVRPNFAFHLVTSENGVVRRVQDVKDTSIRINGGFFVFRQGIFDAIEPDDDLVDQPFKRLIAREELLAYQHDGFFRAMDTIKDRQELEALVEMGQAPWMCVDQAA